MSIKNDTWIRKMAKQGMIDPFIDRQVTANSINGIVVPGLDRLISFGVSSYGYDMRVASEFKIFTNTWPGIIDPKHIEDNAKFHDVTSSDYVIIPPNSFALARSVEYFKIPRNIMTIVLGKSTYARCGIIVNITALEPEWEGQVVVELSNTTPLPSKIYVNEGIAQILFFEAEEVCEQSYKEKHGKYQGQTGIVLSKV
jgi:dCTP deaminase